MRSVGPSEIEALFDALADLERAPAGSAARGDAALALVAAGDRASALLRTPRLTAIQRTALLALLERAVVAVREAAGDVAAVVASAARERERSEALRRTAFSQRSAGAEGRG